MKKIFELIKEFLESEGKLIKQFLELQGRFWGEIGTLFLGWIGVIKNNISKLMYKQRGRFSHGFVSFSVAILSFVAIVFSGQLEDLVNSKGNSEAGGSGYLIVAASDQIGTQTLISDLPKGENTEYRVSGGDTVSSIAQKFGVSIDTIVWENNLKSVESIKPQQILKILPVTGVKHLVKRGETIYSIAKYYGVDAQNIIDYPFNTFSNDETFALSSGQELIVPDGVKPKEYSVSKYSNVAKTVAPIPGVVGEGNFMWPTGGTITQKFYWYHQAVDIANRSNPPIVAAATGSVVAAGWNGGGYGNYVVIDHGNGYRTLYAHLLNNSIVVKAGEKVKQGQRLGNMGSTGRSTGTHLHFEIKTDKGNVNPLLMLK